MPTIFKKALPALALSLGALSLSAQNVPQLSQTAPAGTVTHNVQPFLQNLSLPYYRNYVRRYVPLLPLNDPGALSLGGSQGLARVSTTYEDGLGRPLLKQSQNHVLTANGYKHLSRPIDPRPSRQTLGYLPYATQAAGLRSDMFLNQKNYYDAEHPEEQGRAFSLEAEDNHAGQRGSKSYAPGLSQVGQSRGESSVLVSNGYDEVRCWTMVGDNIVNKGHYPARGLIGARSTDAEGHERLAYKDKGGRIVYQKEYLHNITDPYGVTPVFGETYYIYDDLGRLRVVVPPKASERALSGNLSPVLGSLCFQYGYNERGLLASRQQPGEEGPTRMVYDQRGRLALRQDPALEAQGKWEVVFYDALDRPKATALYASYNDAGYWESELLSPFLPPNNPSSLLFHLKHPEAANLYPEESAMAGLFLLSYQWYDGYAQADPGGSMKAYGEAVLSFTERSYGPGAEEPVPGTYSSGLATGSMVRILASPGADPSKLGEWRRSAIYYDSKDRPLYVFSEDLYGTSVLHRSQMGTQYDFSGRAILVKERVENLNSLDGSTAHVRLSTQEYDPVTGRLARLSQDQDGAGQKEIQWLQYDGMGRLRREALGGGGEVRDYTYNIRGQLTGINGHYAETGQRDGQNRSFGESLKYDHGFSSPRYDGRLSGVVWRGPGGVSARPMAYGYSYNQGGRLARADFRRLEPPGGGYLLEAWRNDHADYGVSGITYDAGGNLLTMDQKGVVPGLGIIDMDQLSYTYEAGGASNRLASVSDAAGTNTYGLGDFQDGNLSGPDYAYDAMGRLTADANKGIAAIAYTHFGKPSRVSFANGGAIEFSYSAAGDKLQELLLPVDSLPKRRDYLGAYVYLDDTLSHALRPCGRTVFGGAYGPREEYFVTDRLGNVRNVLDVHTFPLEEYLASYEIASSQIERAFFSRHDEVRDLNPLGGPGDDHSGRLNGADPSRRIGTALLVHVMAGDAIELSVNTFFDGYRPSSTTAAPASEILSALTTALTGGGGGLGDGDKDKALLAGQLLSGIPASFLGTMMSSATQANLPPAHLNFVFLNKDMEPVGHMSHSYQANGNGDWSPVGPPQPIQIEENGYICVFLSSRAIDPGCTSCGDVYFDDLWMRVHRGAVKEEAHYYPHGLPMRALSAVLPGQAGNRHRYQGKEHIEELGLGWMDFHARQYDPQIGRFLSVDPLGDASGQETYGTYAAMGNMPESTIDPDGMLWGGGPPRWENPRGEGAGQVSSLIPNLHLYMPGGALFNVNTFASMMIRGSFSVETQSKVNNQQSGSYTVPDISAMYGAGGTTRCDHGGSSVNSSGGDGIFKQKKYRAVTIYEPGTDEKTIVESKGLLMTMLYVGSQSYDQYQWFQVVTTTDPIDGMSSPYIDDSREMPFFYVTPKEMPFYIKEARISEAEFMIYDQPSRDSRTNLTWSATSTLVGRNSAGEAWSIIGTFSWGWSMNGGEVIVTPWQTITTPLDISNRINSYNIKNNLK